MRTKLLQLEDTLSLSNEGFIADVKSFFKKEIVDIRDARDLPKFKALMNKTIFNPKWLDENVNDMLEISSSNLQFMFFSKTKLTEDITSKELIENFTLAVNETKAYLGRCQFLIEWGSDKFKQLEEFLRKETDDGNELDPDLLQLIFLEFKETHSKEREKLFLDFKKNLLKETDNLKKSEDRINPSYLEPKEHLKFRVSKEEFVKFLKSISSQFNELFINTYQEFTNHNIGKIPDIDNADKDYLVHHMNDFHEALDFLFISMIDPEFLIKLNVYTDEPVFYSAAEIFYAINKNSK